MRIVLKCIGIPLALLMTSGGIFFLGVMGGLGIGLKVSERLLDYAEGEKDFVNLRLSTDEFIARLEGADLVTKIAIESWRAYRQAEKN